MTNVPITDNRVRHGASRCGAVRWGAVTAVGCGAVQGVRCSAVQCGAVQVRCVVWECNIALNVGAREEAFRGINEKYLGLANKAFS